MKRFDLIVAAVAVVLAVTLLLTFLLGNPAPQPARIAYLAPSRGLSNIWVVDPAKPDEARQVTFSPTGVFDFEASPDGRSIAFAQQSETGVHEIMLLELATGTVRQLTTCEQEDATCTTPSWRPDGSTIAYQRTALNTLLNLQAGSSRIWLIDMTNNSTFPLFTESQILGYGAQWSGDGSHIALYDSINGNILVYNFNALGEDDRLNVVSAGNGSVGALSPDGTRLIYPELVLDASRTRAVLRLADLNTSAFRSLTPEDELADDLSVAWHPDGKRVAFTRQYLDDRYTLGHQVYVMDVSTNSVTPLVNDENYTSGLIEWSPDGTQLVIQRADVPSRMESTPEIWVYTLETSQLERVVPDGYIPGWVPGTD